VSRTKLHVEWSEGAAPEAMVEAFSESALTLAVLDALLDDPELRKKALAALTKGSAVKTR
jgi:hypothetical protein